MAVQDQDLGPLPQAEVDRPRVKHRGVQPLIGPVVQIDPVPAEILSTLPAHAGHLPDVVRLRRRLELWDHLVIVVLHLRKLLRRGRHLICLPLLSEGIHRPQPGGQQGRLLHHQPSQTVHPRQGGLLRDLPQLLRQQAHHRLGVGGPRPHRLPHAGQVRRQPHAPYGHQCQTQSHAPPDHPEPVPSPPSLPHAGPSLSCVPLPHCMRRRSGLEGQAQMFSTISSHSVDNSQNKPAGDRKTRPLRYRRGREPIQQIRFSTSQRWWQRPCRRRCTGWPDPSWPRGAWPSRGAG